MRDEKSLKAFILKNYTNFPGNVVPTELPTFSENMMEAMSEIYHFISQIYASDNTSAKIILSFLFGVIFVLFSAVCYFGCFSTDEPRMSKRNSSRGRESTSSERSSLANDKSRNSTAKPENEGVKKRSTARRRE